MLWWFSLLLGGFKQKLQCRATDPGTGSKVYADNLSAYLMQHCEGVLNCPLFLHIEIYICIYITWEIDAVIYVTVQIHMEIHGVHTWSF